MLRMVVVVIMVVVMMVVVVMVVLTRTEMRTNISKSEFFPQ